MSGTYYSFKPGLHSHNADRLAEIAPSSAKRRMGWLQWLLLMVGVACLGYYGYTLADQTVYQTYENWAFDQQIAGRTGVTFQDYVREQTPLGFLAGAKSEAKPSVAVLTPLAEGAVIGRVAIDRLKLSAVVRQGVDNDTLSQAVGHVPSTAMAGQTGNFAIAAHRDTLFRSLKDIQKGDLVTFQSPTAVFDYRVVSTKIVKPTDVSVLRPDGGGLVEAGNGKLLTMITCYPFYYVGSAPKRFIVQAQLVN